MHVTDIDGILAAIAATPGCFVRPTTGKPSVTKPHQLPTDLVQFYELCGGVVLFESASYPISIVTPQSLIPANPVIIGKQISDDISMNWYIIANDLNGDYFTIDLNHERLGRCYDSFWDSHGQVGGCKVVAVTFTDFLSRMLNNAGRHWYFLQPEFVSLGDAYDENVSPPP